MRLGLLFTFFVATQVLLAQTFTEVPPASDFEGVSAGAIAFADVDGDGDSDVLITGLDGSLEPIAKLYTNDGTGSYTEVVGTPFDVVYNSSVAFADVEGDGDSDVLITGENDSARIAKLYTNDGTGSFTEVMGTPFDGVTVGSVAFSDVDGDGDNDVLITGTSNPGRIAKLYTNNGTGSFSEVMGTPFAGVSRSSIAFADVDGDGDSDVLITGDGGAVGEIAKLYTNDGMGSFTEVIDTFFVGVSNSSIAFSDVDGDGDSDVLITGQQDFFEGFAKLYTNDGTGSFAEVMGAPFDGVYNSSIAFSDVDSDGDSDVLIVGENDSERIAKLYTNDGAGSFAEVMGTNFDGVDRGASIAFSDVDGDGDSDLLITGRNNSFERIAKLYTNDGMGNYPVVLPPPFEDVGASSIAFSDVDGDGDSDVLITGVTNSGRISKLYTNDGASIFTEVMGTPFEAVASGCIAFSDVDGDGDSDVLITGRTNSGRISKLYTNDGMGSFTEVTGTPFPGVSVSYVAFSDVDGDGDNDVLITGASNPGPEIVKLYTNDGMGNFTEVTDTPFNNIKVRRFAFSDVDGDGDSDLLMIGRNNSGPPFALFAKLYSNDGTGSFTEVMGTPFEGTESSAIAFSDVDGDGDSDVLITGAISPGVNIAKLYTNDGTGNYTEATGTPFAGVYYSSIAFSDVDGDGDSDVLITGAISPDTYIAKLYTNDGTGSYTEVMGTPFDGVAGGSNAIAFSDIDGDGDSDVLITGGISLAKSIAKLYTNDGALTSSVEAQNTLDLDFVVYPNPTAATQLNIRYQANENSLTTVQVFDGNGRRLIRQQRRAAIGQQIFSIDITSLVQGIYFVELEDGKKRGVARIIVQ
ncbi:MAG: T9SS type A sorting domain-containing protein [Phaeodactylibacter sp.]|nr:T9SS type A sorting domain-containing protein [Phaeodactylibacter sp.]